VRVILFYCKKHWQKYVQEKLWLEAVPQYFRLLQWIIIRKSIKNKGYGSSHCKHNHCVWHAWSEANQGEIDDGAKHQRKEQENDHHLGFWLCSHQPDQRGEYNQHEYNHDARLMSAEVQ